MAATENHPHPVDVRAKDVPDEHHIARTGQWLPQDFRTHNEWLNGVAKHVDNNPRPLHPVLVEFQDLIESSPNYTMLFTEMFDQVPNKPHYKKDVGGKKQIRDYKHMLSVLNHLLTHAPSWNDKSHRVGLVGLPINVVLDYPMATQAGFAAFLDGDVNKIVKKVLNVWGEFLVSPPSAEVLGKESHHWLGEVGRKDLTEVGNLDGKTNHSFEELFECDPSAVHHGYKSWDEFFTRTFREGIRPVEHESDDSVITNACESRPFKLAHDVAAKDRFWVKNQPYAVRDLLAHDPLADSFVGGTIYQAFLSALSYHRWHAPVSGTIKRAFVKDGTYFSQPLFEDFSTTQDADPKGEGSSQAYLACIATRAIIFIEADNKDLGTVAFVGIGMAEVSTCAITVKEGQHVKKGEQIGMFHFGGSTHCLLFQKGVEVSGFPEVGRKTNVPVRSALAKVGKKA